MYAYTLRASMRLLSVNTRKCEKKYSVVQSTKINCKYFTCSLDWTWCQFGGYVFFLSLFYSIHIHIAKSISVYMYNIYFISQNLDIWFLLALGGNIVNKWVFGWIYLLLPFISLMSLSIHVFIRNNAWKLQTWNVLYFHTAYDVLQKTFCFFFLWENGIRHPTSTTANNQHSLSTWK